MVTDDNISVTMTTNPDNLSGNNVSLPSLGDMTLSTVAPTWSAVLTTLSENMKYINRARAKLHSLRLNSKCVRRNNKKSKESRVISSTISHKQPQLSVLEYIDFEEILQFLDKTPTLTNTFIEMKKNQQICQQYLGHSTRVPPHFHLNFQPRRNLSTARYVNNDVMGRLRDKANSNPLDPDKQYEYLRIIAPSHPAEVIKRVESGLYAVNDPIVKLYKSVVVETSASSTSSQDSTKQSVKRTLVLWGVAVAIAYGFNNFFNVKLEDGRSLTNFNVPDVDFESALPTVTFADVAGNTAAMEEVQELTEFLQHPEFFTKMGCKIPKGYLFAGPPGVGKTLLARALAGESKVPFFYASGSQFEEVFVGLGAKRIRKLFKSARQKAPAIIFIDEIDSVADQRRHTFGYSNRGVVNQLLSEMDGVEENSGVIVIAATNDPEILDPAIVREGRFDSKISLRLPNIKEREEILQVHIRNKNLDPEVDLTELATGTVGMSGAQLAALANLAAVKAVEQGQSVIKAKDFEDARCQLLVGPVNIDMQFTPEEIRNTAAHEAGHAIMSLVREATTKHQVYIATIEPRAGSLGHVLPVPKDDLYTMSNEAMLGFIDVAFAGRIGEELMNNFEEHKVTTGCSSDMKNATRYAEILIRDNGYSSEIGYSKYRTSDSKNDKTDEKVFEEVKKLLDERYEVVKKELRKHEKEWRSLTNYLIKYKTLTGAEVQNVFRGGIILRDDDADS